FIEAARSLGFGRRRIIFRHILPNILGPIIVYTTLTIPSVMLLEAFLSFLGLGVQPPMSSWGVLIKDGAEKMEEFPWLLVFPGLIYGGVGGAGLPLLLQHVFARIFAADSARMSLEAVAAIAAGIPLVFLITALSGYLNSYFTQLAGVRVLEALRLDYFHKLQVL